MTRDSKPPNRSCCIGGMRPCPWVSCRYHLYLDVNSSGKTLKFNFKGKELWEIEETCALDVADKGGHTLQEVGDRLGVSKEAVRLVERRVLHKLRLSYLEEESDMDWNINCPNCGGEITSGVTFRGVPCCASCYKLAEEFKDRAKKRFEVVLEGYCDTVSTYLARGELRAEVPELSEWGKIMP